MARANGAQNSYSEKFNHAMLAKKMLAKSRQFR
jgi:hypothetical protein